MKAIPSSNGPPRLTNRPSPSGDVNATSCCCAGRNDRQYSGSGNIICPTARHRAASASGHFRAHLFAASGPIRYHLALQQRAGVPAIRSPVAEAPLNSSKRASNINPPPSRGRKKSGLPGRSRRSSASRMQPEWRTTGTTVPSPGASYNRADGALTLIRKANADLPRCHCADGHRQPRRAGACAVAPAADKGIAASRLHPHAQSLYV